MSGKPMALSFHVKAECNISKARAGVMKLPHYEVKTPVFMPVGTQVRLSYSIKLSINQLSMIWQSTAYPILYCI